MTQAQQKPKHGTQKICDQILDGQRRLERAPYALSAAIHHESRAIGIGQLEKFSFPIFRQDKRRVRSLMRFRQVRKNAARKAVPKFAPVRLGSRFELKIIWRAVRRQWLQCRKFQGRYELNRTLGRNDSQVICTSCSLSLWAEFSGQFGACSDSFHRQSCQLCLVALVISVRSP